MTQNILPVGATLKGATEYTIVEHLHNGGFGITYRATAQIMVGNIPQTATFTIKEFFMGKICYRDASGNVVVAPENQQAFKSAKADFKSEAEILHSLKHDNIVPVNEVFEQNNTVYYVMSYLGNVSLYQYVAEHGGNLQESQALQIIRPLTSALAYLHNRSILHLDIKPDNIMMVGQGQDAKPVLIDFGQAMYFVNGKPKRDKGVRGYSAGYSPLEQKQTVRAFLPALDVYALTATLLYMLCGVDPCDASGQSVHKIYKALPETVSQNTMDAIVCGLQKEAANRPQTISAFQNLLANGKPTSPNGSTSIGDGAIVTDAIITNNDKSLPFAKILVAVACLAVVAVIGWLLWSKVQGSNTPTEPISVLDSMRFQQADSVSSVADAKQAKQADASTDESAGRVQPAQKEERPVKSEQKESPTSPAKSVPAKSSPTSGTINLGYATWTGGLLNGKPHGKGTMKFLRPHAVSGCSTTPEAGDYIVGFCENGVIQNGGLYRDGQKIDTVIR